MLKHFTARRQVLVEHLIVLVVLGVLCWAISPSDCVGSARHAHRRCTVRIAAHPRIVRRHESLRRVDQSNATVDANRGRYKAVDQLDPLVKNAIDMRRNESLVAGRSRS